MFLQRLRRLLQGEPASGQPSPAVNVRTPSRHPCALTDADRIELQRAIIEHLEWCVLLNTRLGSDASEPMAALPNAEASGLGRWLASARTGALGAHPQFDELVHAQLRFHRLADQALAFADQDQMHQASTLLNTDFERCRARILAILRDMQRH